MEEAECLEKEQWFQPESSLCIKNPNFDSLRIDFLSSGPEASPKKPPAKIKKKSSNSSRPVPAPKQELTTKTFKKSSAL